VSAPIKTLIGCSFSTSHVTKGPSVVLVCRSMNHTTASPEIPTGRTFCISISSVALGQPHILGSARVGASSLDPVRCQTRLIRHIQWLRLKMQSPPVITFFGFQDSVSQA